MRLAEHKDSKLVPLIGFTSIQIKCEGRCPTGKTDHGYSFAIGRFHVGFHRCDRKRVKPEGKDSIAPELDMLGNPRKNMERIDLGAIESSFVKLDSFAITSVETNMETPNCEGVAMVSFTGGTPPFSFYLNGEPNEGNSFESLCSASYEISVKDADGEMITTTIDVVTGIDDPVSGEESLKIYPNPTNNLLTIESEYPDHYSIEITSLNGQQLFTGEMEGTSHQFDLSHLQKGVYFITIRSTDFINTRKIIKL